MNIAVISFKDVDVTLGIQELIQTYAEDKPIFFLPLIKPDSLFTQSVIETCQANNVEVHCFFPNANGFEGLLKLKQMTLSSQTILSKKYFVS
jgi:hypothetical protein